jgi:hypothetical protein
MWSRVLWNLDLRLTALARPSSNCAVKEKTCPLVRVGAPKMP